MCYVNSCDIQKPEHAIRFSKRGYRKDGQITNIPLYLASKTKELLQEYLRNDEINGDNSRVFVTSKIKKIYVKY